MKNNELFSLLDNIKKDNNLPSFTKHSRVLLIDGLNLFFRNFATLNYINNKGVHIGGLAGFLRSLGGLIKITNPTSVYVVFDGTGSSTNRRNLFPEYKSNRNSTRITNWDIFENEDDENDAKVNQISRLIHYLKCLPVTIISIDKTEADDIIAHLALQFSQDPKSMSYIVSNDGDYLQLVKPNITVYRPSEKEFYTESTVLEKFCVLPSNFILYKTLIGDTGDYVHGIKGLGKKKLIKLFPELGTKESSLDDLIRISGENYKKHILYSKIVFEQDKLKKNFQLMDLKNPLVNQEQIVILNEIKEQPTNQLDIPSFVHMYNEDGLGNVLKNVKHWLPDTFKVLNSFK